MTVDRTGPLDGWSARFAALPAGFQITPDPFVAMTDVRGTRIPGLPTRPNTWAPRGSGRAIWLGPDEWLITGSSEDVVGAAVGADVVVDVSGQRTTLRLTGAHVRAVLATGCAIDLHPRAFPPGSAAQTLLGRAGVVLLALDDGEYEVLVRTSYSRYLADWLLDAAAEFSA